MSIHSTWLAAVLIALALPVAAGIRVGVTPGALADSIAVAATEAKTQGLDVEVVEFSDWTTPNLALENGDLDLNYFQHQAFLDNALKETGYHLRSVALGILPNIGLYSEKYQSLDAIPEGARVAIASDPVNQGRGLALLETAGLIGLTPGIGWQATLDDVTANPRGLRFVEIEGPQLVRITGDVDLAQGYPHFIVASGAFDPTSGLIYSGIEDKQFAVAFVARADNKDDPRIGQFVDLFHTSQAVRARVHESFAQSDKLYILAWQG